jgi:hypothetical protein
MIHWFRVRRLALAAAFWMACGLTGPAMSQQINPTVLAPSARNLIPQGSMKVVPREGAVPRDGSSPSRRWNGQETHPDQGWHHTRHHRQHHHFKHFTDECP